MALGDKRQKLLLATGFVLGVGAFAWVLRSALDQAAPPSRCAAGMHPAGPRCCGEGQTLVEGRCVGRPTQCAKGLDVHDNGCVAPNRIVAIQGGVLRIGTGDWEAQGQITPRTVDVPSFAIDAYEVHEARYAGCLAASACAPMVLSGEPGRAISNVTVEEGARFCTWAGGAIPTSDQLAYAAAGSSGRRYAWGETGAVCRRGAWGLVNGPCGTGAIGPEVTGSHPDGASPDGVFDLAGNVAEWTSPQEKGLALVDVRGGSFMDSAASALRSWHRREIDRHTRASDIGFRCVYALGKADTR